MQCRQNKILGRKTNKRSGEQKSAPSKLSRILSASLSLLIIMAAVAMASIARSMQWPDSEVKCLAILKFN